MTRRKLFVALIGMVALTSSAVAQKTAQKTDNVLTHEQIKSTVDGRIADVKGCMKAHGAAKGKVVIRFGVLPTGHIVEPAVREPSSNGPLDKCIVNASKEWVFPARTGNAPVQGVDYPFVFSAPVVVAVPQGTLSREEILKTMNALLPKIGDCLDDARLKKADVVGVITTEIHVGADGKVISVKQLGSTTQYPPVDECVLRQARTLQFSKPEGNAGLVIEYPFVLKAVPAPKK